MKIAEIKTFLTGRYLLVRVYTDSGIIGNGEAELWAHHRLVAEAIAEFGDYFIGKDPRLIEHHHQVVRRHTHFMGSVLSAALSAFDARHSCEDAICPVEDAYEEYGDVDPDGFLMDL